MVAQERDGGVLDRFCAWLLGENEREGERFDGGGHWERRKRNKETTIGLGFFFKRG